jgi:O-antigen ligase
VLGLGALILTYTRAAWAGFLLGGAWLFFIGYKRKIFSTRIIFFVGMCAIFLLFVMSVYMGKRGSISGAYDERFALMQMAMNVIRAHPFNGVGIGAYDHVFKGYLTPELANRWVWKVHNTYLLTVAETGIVGGLALVFFLFSALRLSLRVSRSNQPILQVTATGCGAGIISLCFVMYWEALDGFYHNVLFWFLFGVMAAADTGRIRRGDG